jgi:hypothetical protein
LVAMQSETKTETTSQAPKRAVRSPLPGRRAGDAD